MIRELLMAAGVVTSGCIPDGAAGVTTPIGIYYDGTPLPETVLHEQCHMDKYKEMGLSYWQKYTNDPAWACNEERRCGIEPSDYPEVYPMCKE